MKRYTLAQLEAFMAIAQLGSFRLAAAELGITQPSISLRIRDFEAAIGHAVFLRDHRQLRLTMVGVGVLRHVQLFFTLLNEMESQIADGGVAQGTLRFGASNAFALAYLPAVLADMERNFPKLVIDLTIADSNTLAAAVNSGELDIAILLEGHFRRGVCVEPLTAYEIAWVSKKASNLPEWLSAADIKNHRIATLPATSPLSRTMLDWFDASATPHPIQSRCNDMATLVRLVTAGAALSILPLCVVANEVRQGLVRVHKTELPLTPYQLCAAYPSKGVHPSVEACLEIIRSSIAMAP